MVLTKPKKPKEEKKTDTFAGGVLLGQTQTKSLLPPALTAPPIEKKVPPSVLDPNRQNKFFIPTPSGETMEVNEQDFNLFKASLGFKKAKGGVLSPTAQTFFEGQQPSPESQQAIERLKQLEPEDVLIPPTQTIDERTGAEGLLKTAKGGVFDIGTSAVKGAGAGATAGAVVGSGVGLALAPLTGGASVPIGAGLGLKAGAVVGSSLFAWDKFTDKVAQDRQQATKQAKAYFNVNVNQRYTELLNWANSGQIPAGEVYARYKQHIANVNEARRALHKISQGKIGKDADKALDELAIVDSYLEDGGELYDRIRLIRALQKPNPKNIVPIPLLQQEQVN
jgi:hypothetical protein